MSPAQRAACFLLVLPVCGIAAPPSPSASFDACRLAAAPLPDPLLQMQFETVDGRIYVQALVNGKGPFRFAVDTGASGIGRADASLVATLGLAPHGETTTSDGVSSAAVQAVRLDSLAVGGIVHNNVEVITRDYNARNAPASAFAGIIGREFFADGLLAIDFPHRTLSFSRTQRLPAQGKNVLTYEHAFRIPVWIGDLQTTGQLDTGANIGYVLPQALSEKVAFTVAGPAGRSQLTNGQIETRQGTLHGPVRVGTLQARDVEARVSSRYPELLVGAHALQGAVVLIDQRSKAVAVCD